MIAGNFSIDNKASSTDLIIVPQASYRMAHCLVTWVSFLFPKMTGPLLS